MGMGLDDSYSESSEGEQDQEYADDLLMEEMVNRAEQDELVDLERNRERARALRRLANAMPSLAPNGLPLDPRAYDEFSPFGYAGGGDGNNYAGGEGDGINPRRI